MNILVTGRHVDVSNEVRTYVEEKTGKLPRFYDRIREIEVILGHESEQFNVEIIVRADRKHTFVASESGPDTFALVDVVVDRLERQLTKYKEKTRDHKHNGKSDFAAEIG